VRDLWGLSQTNRSRMAPSRKTMSIWAEIDAEPIGFFLVIVIWYWINFGRYRKDD